MKYPLNEFVRSGKILLHFVRQLMSLLLIAALSTAVGIGLMVAGINHAVGAISVLGEALLIGGACVVAWRAIAAEVYALAKIGQGRCDG